MNVRIDPKMLTKYMMIRGYSVTSLAQITGLGRVTVSGIRNGRRSCSQKSANLIAAALRVDLKDLLIFE